MPLSEIHVNKSSILIFSTHHQALAFRQPTNLKHTPQLRLENAMTLLLDPSANKINREVSYIHNDEFSHFLSFLAEDAVQRRQQGGAAPTRAIQQIKALKLGALRLPIEHGGRGLSIEALFKVLIEIAQYDNDLPQILRSHFQFVEDVIRSNDKDFQQFWLKQISQGKIIGNAFTEPANQSLVGSGEYQTQLTQVDEHFEVSGTKIFTTGTLYADYVSIRVTDEQHRVLSVIVPTDRAGVERLDDWNGIGQKFTASGTTRFEKVKVFAHEVHPVPAEQVKFKPFTQLLLQSVVAGIVKAISREAVALLQQRKRTFVFAAHADPRQDPLLLERVGEIEASAYIIEQAVLKAAHAQDIAFKSTRDGVTNYALSHQAALEASLVKIAIEPLALNAATQLFDITGASSTTVEHDLDRHWRNIRTLCSHNPASFKAYAVGNLLINKRDLPNNVYF